MKKNDSKYRTLASRNPKEWDEMIDRYYEGLTTSEEEQELRTFLFSREAADPRYEEHRAVMSYTAMGQRYEGATSIPYSAPTARYAIKPFTRWMAAAAVITILLVTGISLYINHSRNEVYVAYVYGRKYTSPEIVSEQMQQSFHNVSVPETHIEKELGDMFGELSPESTRNQ